MTIDELRKSVGTPYTKTDQNGNGLGCLLPFYLLYPDAPKFPWPDGDVGSHLIVKLKEYCEEVSKVNMQPGDLIIIRMPRGFTHAAVYLGGGKLIHCSMGNAVETLDLSIIRSDRVKGVFRWIP